MRSSTKLIVLCILIVRSCSSPIREDDPLPSIHLDGESKEYIKTASRASRDLKLQSFIDHMEKNLLNVALGVSSLAHDQDAFIPNVTPQKREVAEQPQTDPTTQYNLDKSTESTRKAEEVLLQTTKRIPAKDAAPAHILIDRVSVQTLNGSEIPIPIIPIFEVQHTKQITATIKENPEGNPTVVNITKTTTTSGKVKQSQSKSQQEKAERISAESVDRREVDIEQKIDNNSEAMNTATDQATDAASSNATTTTATTTTTTKAPIVKLKEAENELKKKVAEIEAEPVILSSRI